VFHFHCHAAMKHASNRNGIFRYVLPEPIELSSPAHTLRF
jgi:hypothetical protein